jgi:hypothetical protein
MELGPYVESIRTDLKAAVEAAGAEAVTVAERVLGAVDAAVRLALLDALSSASDEITRDLAPGSVEVRLRGREPEFVVTQPAATEPVDDVPPTEVLDDDLSARISLRLPESLKAPVEEAANRDRISVNSWLIRVLAVAVGEARPYRGDRRGGVGHHRTGWVR